VIPIEVPPLRERREDIPVLIETFMAESVKKYGGRPKMMDAAVRDLLCAYDWPGNVRELKNLVERLAIMVQEERITVNDMPAPYNPAGYRSAASEDTSLFSANNLEKAMQGFESIFLKRKLSENHGDIDKTAGILKITTGKLKLKLEKYAIR